VGSVGRVILIDRTSDADQCVASWFMTEFFMPSVRRWETFGRCDDRIGRSAGFKGGWYWSWSDPTMRADFITRVEADALERLRPLNTVSKCLNFARTRPETFIRLDSHWYLFAAIALGELDAAREIWAKTEGYYRLGRVLDEPCDQLIYDRLCLIDEPLMADDRAGLAALLHRWEAEAIVGSPLEPHWVAERFPLEEG
jgi:hypothetical protein